MARSSKLVIRLELQCQSCVPGAPSMLKNGKDAESSVRLWFNSFLLAVLVLAASWFFVEGALTEHYARGRMVWTWDKVNQNLKEMAQTMDEFRKGVTTWSEGSKEQAKQTTLAMSHVNV